jgi:hypothetical protein
MLLRRYILLCFKIDLSVLAVRSLPSYSAWSCLVVAGVGLFSSWWLICSERKVLLGGILQLVRSVYQPPASSTFLSKQTSHQQSASSTFLL